MDMKMNIQSITAKEHPVWDVVVKDGIVPIIAGEEEQLQRALLAVFLQQHSIAQAPLAGIPWTDFFTHKATFGELDRMIRSSLTAAGVDEYMPEYFLDSAGEMTIRVGKRKE